MSRLETAIAYVTPQSEQIPHCHAPNGGMCRDCEHYLDDGETNPNFNNCEFFGRANTDWSCVLFKRTDRTSRI